MKEIAEIIKQERIKRNLSYEEIAQKAGVTSRAVRLWERNERSISLKNADKVLKALDVSLTIGKKSVQTI